MGKIILVIVYCLICIYGIVIYFAIPGLSWVHLMVLAVTWILATGWLRLYGTKEERGKK